MAEQNFQRLEKSLQDLQECMEEALAILNDDSMIAPMKVQHMRDVVHKIFDCEVQFAALALANA